MVCTHRVTFVLVSVERDHAVKTSEACIIALVPVRVKLLFGQDVAAALHKINTLDHVSPLTNRLLYTKTLLRTTPTATPRYVWLYIRRTGRTPSLIPARSSSCLPEVLRGPDLLIAVRNSNDKVCPQNHQIPIQTFSTPKHSSSHSVHKQARVSHSQTQTKS